MQLEKLKNSDNHFLLDYLKPLKWRGVLHCFPFVRMEQRETGNGQQIHSWTEWLKAEFESVEIQKRGSPLYILKDGEYSKIMKGEFTIIGPRYQQ